MEPRPVPSDPGGVAVRLGDLARQIEAVQEEMHGLQAEYTSLVKVLADAIDPADCHEAFVEVGPVYSPKLIRLVRTGCGYSSYPVPVLRAEKVLTDAAARKKAAEAAARLAEVEGLVGLGPPTEIDTFDPELG